jgi:hypothetical protein
MGSGLHSCGMWLHHRITEGRHFETNKLSHLEGYNIRRTASRMLKKKSVSVTVCTAKRKNLANNCNILKYILRLLQSAFIGQVNLILMINTPLANTNC